MTSIAAVNHARAQGLKLIAKSGGHSISGSFLRDGGMLLDLLGMREVEVDPVMQTATAEPGTWGPTLLHALEPHGFGFPVATGRQRCYRGVPVGRWPRLQPKYLGNCLFFRNRR